MSLDCLGEHGAKLFESVLVLTKPPDVAEVVEQEVPVETSVREPIRLSPTSVQKSVHVAGRHPPAPSLPALPGKVDGGGLAAMEEDEGKLERLEAKCEQLRAKRQKRDE